MKDVASFESTNASLSIIMCQYQLSVVVTIRRDRHHVCLRYHGRFRLVVLSPDRRLKEITAKCACEVCSGTMQHFHKVNVRTRHFIVHVSASLPVSIQSCVQIF